MAVDLPIPSGQLRVTAPSFIDRDPAVIRKAFIDTWQAVTGKTVYPAQVEYLLADAVSYRETLTRIGIQQACLLNLVAFSHGVMLDLLGQLVGIARLPAQPALTTLQWTLTGPQNVDVLIPAGTQVTDGTLFVATTAALRIAAGDTVGTVKAAVTTPGPDGNGIQVNNLTQPTDAFPVGVASVTNLDISALGASPENDDRLRARIILAPTEESAGTSLHYRQKAMAADVTISDASVLSSSLGIVDVYILTVDGLPAQDLLNLVAKALKADDVRMITDDIRTHAPEVISYSVDADIYVFSEADPATTMAAVSEAWAEYEADRDQLLGQDIVPSQIIAALSVPGVYEVVLNSPSAQQILTPGQWAQLISANFTLAGLQDG